MMENRAHNFPTTSEDIYRFATGEGGEGRKTPVRIAWSLENAAMREGWEVGRWLGCEDDLIRRFGVSRERMREAIRIIEARGAMRMQTGPHGGLRLQRPDLDRAASALAAYLHATGYSESDAPIARCLAEQMFAELPPDALVARLHHRVVEMLASGEFDAAMATGRVSTIARRLIARAGVPIRIEGFDIGSAATLCEEFCCTRRTLRQALRILDDLGMLQVRRGRGGGYLLKRPEPIGIIRQLFALFASRRQQHTDMLPAIWALNIVHLRLAMRELDRLGADARGQHCQELTSIIAEYSEPQRWSLLQKALAKIANDTMTITLTQCCIAYFARSAPSVGYEACDEQMREAEVALVEAVRRGDKDTAERLQRAVQVHLSRLAGC